MKKPIEAAHASPLSPQAAVATSDSPRSLLDAVLSRASSLFAVTSAQPRPSWERIALLMLVAIGAMIRFWGLGDVGLHGDEETMALPVRHIVEEGTPYFPSGMFYGRAIAQLYLMAGSVLAFGESEWALRLPSVLCGIALIALA